MRLVKIVLWILIILLVALALVVERPVVASLLGQVNLQYYYRAAILTGLIVALLLAWGYKRKVEASRRYAQAEKILAQAEATAKRRERACMLLEEKIKAGYADKEKGWLQQITALRLEHKQQLALLQTQNRQFRQALDVMLKTVRRKKDPRIEKSDKNMDHDKS